MKKINRIALVIYIILGIVLVIMGFTIQIDYYSSLLVAMGVGLICSSIMQFVRFHHNMKPENIDKYREKERKQVIDLKDERKVQLRNRAGYITWALTIILLLVVAFIVALFHINNLVIYILVGTAIVQYVLAVIIYKYLCNKM